MPNSWQHQIRRAPLARAVAIFAFASMSFGDVVRGQVTPRKALATSEIAKLATPATVTILAIDSKGDTLGQGSGFFVRPSGELVTNWHVVAGSSRLVVVLTNGERYERVQALDGDESGDLALLKVSGIDFPFIALQGVLPPPGGRTVVIGSPLGLSHTVSEGIVSAQRILDGRSVLQISAPISPGSSGGPVLDDQAHVVGIATWYLQKGQQLNFAVPAKYAIALLRDAGAPKPVAELFGGSKREVASTPEPTPVAPSISNAPSNSLPARASNPRSSLTGSYYVTESGTVAEPGKPPRSINADGIALINAKGVGFCLWVRERAPGDSIRTIYLIESALAAPDGRAGLRLHQQNFDGYQTDEGAVLDTKDPFGNWQYAGRLTMQSSALPLTMMSGSYAVTVRTTYRAENGVTASELSDWNGEAILMANRDSVYFGLELVNKKGGTTQLWGLGKMNEQSEFVIEDKQTGSSFRGYARAGQLYGSWFDKRGKASFSGNLSGTRR